MGQAPTGGLLPGGVKVGHGRPTPRGCCEERGGGAVNFVLDAPGSTSAWLLFALPPGHVGLTHVGVVADGDAELFVLLDPAKNKTGDTWHIELTPPFVAAGVRYMWLLDPDTGDDKKPLPSAARILDPCARELDSMRALGWNRRGAKRYSPRAVVPDNRTIYDFQWQGVNPPGLHLKDLVIYEAHVRGFTRNRDSALSDWEALAGTYLGFVEKIPYLKRLGVNCIELLPVFEYDETACPRKNPFTGEHLCNYWGYSTVSFCVPMQRFSSRDRLGAAIVGFKTTVRELHRQGIEVLLDVVFNHTAEGTWGEFNWHSLAAIAKPRYYLLNKGLDTNYTGCGNTVNANDPLCADWIIECLRYWVEEMHVDGFRFDLGSALCRGGDGQILKDPHVIKRMVTDPVLSRAKLIAEPWDCSWPDGYLVGKFPSCGPPRFAEWNGMYRDTVRRFIKGDQGTKGDFATRIAGSADLFQHNGRGPFHSINFVTAHDGFTLRDLVSYDFKHNDCNNEKSGDDHNNSWNCGTEGEAKDGHVLHLREKQMRNFLVALLLSCGTPMLAFGDEYGRSQNGCNNGWCQDALSWFSWKACSKEETKLFRFTRLLITLRKQYSHIFCRTTFLSQEDIWWRVHWDDPYNYVCFVLHDRQAKEGYAALLVAFNAGNECRGCNLPSDKQWYRLIDTNLVPPHDFCENEHSAVRVTTQEYMMQPFSCIVLKTFGGAGDAIDYGKTDMEFQSEQLIQDLFEITNRRMSMELTSLLTPPLTEPKVNSNETFVLGFLQRRSSMSGCFVELASTEPGKGPTMIVQRPTLPHEHPETESAITQVDRQADLKFEPPPRRAAVRPHTCSPGTELLAADLGRARHVEVLLFDGADDTAKVLGVTVNGFGEEALVLHWGALEAGKAGWQQPPAEIISGCFPQTDPVPGAAQSKFTASEADGDRTVFLLFRAEYIPEGVAFVLHQPPNQWIKHGDGDFLVKFPKSQKEMDAAVQRVTDAIPPGTSHRTKSWTLLDFRLVAVAFVGSGGCTVKMIARTDKDVMLHYGAGDEHSKWIFARSVDFAASQDAGVKEATATLTPDEITDRMMFVLRLGKDQWVKDGLRDFAFELPENKGLVAARAEAQARKKAEAEALRQQIEREASVFHETLSRFREGREGRKQAADVSFGAWEISDGAGDVEITCCKADGGNVFQVEVLACLDPRVAPVSRSWLHWGAIMDSRRKEWTCPPEELLPAGTILKDKKACQSPLDALGSGLYGVCIKVPSKADADGPAPQIAGMGFVLYVAEENKWLKSTDGDCIAIFQTTAATATGWKGVCSDVAARIVEAECQWSHMTLMHRYNLCKEIVERWECEKSGDDSSLRRLPSWTGIFRAGSRRSTSWSRLPSFTLMEAISAQDAEASDADFWSWVFVWQRFSFMRLLDWQRNYNTKPKELAGATDGLANKLCAVWKKHPNIRLWCRWTLATLGRGGNRGQDIRDEILHIMHRNNIPETSGHFYEQWHQKLHNNTTPDDVGICKALLAFLRSAGNMAEYWRVLKDHGITAELLASYQRAITKEPYLHGNTGQLILDFEHYLEILQSVHDALDLQTSIVAAQWCLPTELQRKLQGFCRNSNASHGKLSRQRSRSLSDLQSAKDTSLDGHQRFMRLADARAELLAILNNKRTEPDVIRQMLLLDYSLETQQAVLIQGMNSETRLTVLSDQMQALLTSILGHMPLHGELQAVLVDWMQLAPECAALRYNRSAVESALLLKAMCDRLSRVVGELVDTFQTMMGEKAHHLGRAVGARQQILEVFVDEVLRASALFSVSLVLKRLEPQLRGIAHLPPWQMISTVDRPVHGELQVVERMLHMQEKIFETPTILLSGAVSGEEEVPVGVQAVLVRDAASAPDILSHCAVRARNSGVLLATCFDSELIRQIEAELVGHWVEIICKQDGTLSIERAERPGSDRRKLRSFARSKSRDLTQELLQSKPGDTKLVNMNVSNDLNCKWCVTPDEMDHAQVGSKSLNLAKLSPMLPADVRTPQAVAMPYGCMQKVLTHSDNAKEWLPKLKEVLQDLQPTTSNDHARVIFEKAQAIIESLSMPTELVEALMKAMESAGDKDGERRLCKLFDKQEAWGATRKVWASLFGLRPWVSLAKANRSFHDLNMAVLVQELLPSKYAFVLHTKNPFTNDPNEVYGEVVPGRGETLVGNCPGRALSFRAKKGEDPVVSAFLSKSTWLRTQECLIFRSDSNGEDLEGFAGAGLFESICAKADTPCMVRFHRLQIIVNPGYRQDLLQRLADVGRQVEKAFGGTPQDVEGCVDPQDRIFIVQSRPQV